MRTSRFLARYALLITLVALCVVTGFLNPVFLSLDNLTNILLQSAVNLIIALGMTFVIIVGGIDLSVGSLVALTGMVLGLFLVHGVAAPVAILGAVLLGGLCGGINGIVITRWRVPAFIVTLGMMSAARGFALMLTSGRSVSGFSTGFLWLGNRAFAGLPFPALVAFVLAALCAVALRGTVWGTYRGARLRQFCLDEIGHDYPSWKSPLQHIAVPGEVKIENHVRVERTFAFLKRSQLLFPSAKSALETSPARGSCQATQLAYRSTPSQPTPLCARDGRTVGQPPTR